MSEANGTKPRPDPAILTPNDLKRCKVALGGQSPHELLAEPESMFQVLILALGLRDDSAFTFDRAGDERLGDWFDMSGSDEPDPPTAVPGSPGRGAATKPADSSRMRRVSSVPASSSATTSASPVPSTTP